VLQNNGTAYPFTRSVGTNANQVSWGGAPSAVNHSPGGFAAKGAKFIVNLGGSSEMLTWASTPFFVGWSNKVQHLVFGSTTADKVIEFQNPINLNNATRTIQVNDNTNSVTDIAVLSGALTNGALTKTGAGVLHLDGANTYTGRTTVSAGYIGGNGSLVGSLTITNGAGFHAASGKTLHVASNVTLYATSILSEPGLPVGASHIVLTYGGTLTGSFGVTNLPAGSVVDYGTRTNSLITLTRPQSGTVFSFR
jgi:autotransporter-associated beta strand protein